MCKADNSLTIWGTEDLSEWGKDASHRAHPTNGKFPLKEIRRGARDGTYMYHDSRDESGKIYRLCIAPLLSIIMLTFSGLLNRYCAVVFVGKTEVLIIGGVSLFCCSCFIGKTLMDEET